MSESDCKKECLGCRKLITAPNFAKHKKRCKVFQELPSTIEAAQINPDNLQDEINKLTQELHKKDEELQKRDEELEFVKRELQKANTMLQTRGNYIENQHNYNDIHIDVLNQFYVLDVNGIKNGLDLSMVKSIGTENVDYLKNMSPLPPLQSLLKNIYASDEHVENRVLSHLYRNNQYIIMKYSDHFLIINLGNDKENFSVFQKKIMENMENIFGRTWDNFEEVRDAVQNLLWALNGENDQNKWVPESRPDFKLGEEEGKCVIWNFNQFDNGLEQRHWKPYMNNELYSGNLVK